jgi:hypothetical protein
MGTAPIHDRVEKQAAWLLIWTAAKVLAQPLNARGVIRTNKNRRPPRSPSSKPTPVHKPRHGFAIRELVRQPLGRAATLDRLAGRCRNRSFCI